MNRPMRVSGPSDHPPYAIRYSFTISGYARVICDRITHGQLFIPANDTDHIRW